MKTRLGRASAIVVAVAVAAVASATTYALSQDADVRETPGVVQPAAINNAQKPEATFVPIAPCRLLDTRAGTSPGRIASGQQKYFDVVGSNLSSQGGSASGCGIPDAAVAIEANVTAVAPLGTGFLRGDAVEKRLFDGTDDPGPLPNATMVSYASGVQPVNGTTIPVCNQAQGTGGGLIFLFFCKAGKEIRFGAFTNATHVVADVVGYYVIPVHGMFNGSVANDVAPTLIRHWGVDGVTHDGTGEFTVDVNRDLRGCEITVTAHNSDDAQNAGAGSAVLTDIDGTGQLLEITRYNGAGNPVNDDFGFIANC